MKTIWTLMCALCFVTFTYYGCDVPYSGGFGPGDLDRLLEAQGDDTICLADGFDTVCIKTIPGKNGRDGNTLIAVKEVPVEVIVEKIVEKVVTNTEVVEVAVVVERVVEVIKEVEVPIEVFVTETIEVIKEIPKVKIVEVPVQDIVEAITVYVEVPAQPEPVHVTAGATYTEAGYADTPEGFHPHSITHTHDGAEHIHKFIHPDGEADDWDRAHDGFSGLTHD